MRSGVKLRSHRLSPEPDRQQGSPEEFTAPRLRHLNMAPIPGRGRLSPPPESHNGLPSSHQPGPEAVTKMVTRP